MFCCPRATKGCDDANGTFFVTTLTFSVLPRSIGAEVENIESNVHIRWEIMKVQIFVYDFHYNIATTQIQYDVPLSTVRLRCLDNP